MKISFFVEYVTTWGQELALSFERPLAAGAPATVRMSLIPGTAIWHASLAVADPSAAAGAEYTYHVVADDGTTLRSEWRGHAIPAADPSAEALDLFDSWADRPADSPYLSTVFTECVCRRPATRRPEAPLPAASSLTFEAVAPMVPTDATLAVCGSLAELGAWNPAHAVRLTDHSFPAWRATVNIPQGIGSFEYKFLIVDSATGEVRSWEPRTNRVFVRPVDAAATDAIVISGLNVSAPLPLWRGAGTAIPVFSLRSADDWGCGDFADIRLMADWTTATGQRIIQLLPVNDTSMTGTRYDSYPYNSISSFALHPLYLRLQDAGELADPARRSHYEEARQRLQAEAAVDYEGVIRLKLDYMRELFAQDGPSTILADDFTAFVEQNTSWLTPYAAFCVLRDRFGTPDMSRWGEYATYQPNRIAAFVDANIADIQFVYFLQYHLDRQLRQARNYCHSRGVALKGDIPIGISRTSVDAWIHPELYNLDASAGAPPDDFAVDGQNWGFPTYNWDAMARDNYQWWKNRFRHMARYFDAYRIDHVLGFFRIWQIPLTQIHGLLGVFCPALPFTPEELMAAYGFRFIPELHAIPYIADWTLPRFFGDRADEVKERFLAPVGEGRYILKPQFATQRDIADWAATLPADSADAPLVAPLLGLVDQVLFLPDPVREGMWHPRIAAQNTVAYEALNHDERRIYDNLYNDFFYRRNDAFWRSKAMEKLPPIIEATGMLTCAEDLGMIPACVPSVMDELRILSLEIQRMPKETGRRFGDPATYPYLSVCATSTHDMPGIRGWWEADRSATQSFYNDILHQHGEAPFYAEPWICSLIVESNLRSPSMLCIIPLQDYLSTDGALRRENPADEVINIPADPHHYWRYRMHLTLEQLLGADEFNSRLRSLIAASGR